MPKHEDKVRQLVKDKTPGHALVYLARVLDDLAADGRPGEWDLPDARDHVAAVASSAEWTEEQGQAAFEKAVAALGPDPGGEDSAAWAAQRRLLADLKAAPTPDVGRLEPGTVEVAVDKENIIVDLKPPTAGQLKIREAMVEKLGLDKEGWHKPEIPPCGEQYRKGGPMYLYLAYRDYITSLPAAIISDMVKDVAITSHADAAQMSGDLMRRDDPLATSDRALWDKVSGILS